MCCFKCYIDAYSYCSIYRFYLILWMCMKLLFLLYPCDLRQTSMVIRVSHILHKCDIAKDMHGSVKYIFIHIIYMYYCLLVYTNDYFGMILVELEYPSLSIQV